VHLVQVLLPTVAPPGTRLDEGRFAQVLRELTERFGGVTAYMRAPALGLWKRDDETVERDDVVMVEVVVDALDRGWWTHYRQLLAARFGQEVVHVRAMTIDLL
jgi:hypothetical protein